MSLSLRSLIDQKFESFPSGMTYCGYCQRVKQLLTQLGATFKVLELDEMSKKPTKSLSLNLDCQDAGKTVMIMGLINNFAKAHVADWSYVLSKMSAESGGMFCQRSVQHSRYSPHGESFLDAARLLRNVVAQSHDLLQSTC
ncbi:hypothetical protein F2Q68_00017390 [Brassica cretica]|uniref:Glutaredoxin domain-containing protein n=1 Tax=Brassica cretica TaxID=69181 RepID=A0A8S9HEE0_BRACR|nr:hypothetical protein F2Q68_00017390 [Brassica cretica]